MKQWWQQLQLREQKLIIVMGSVIGIFILYNMIWQPLNENLIKEQQKLKREEALLSWVMENTQRYKQMNAGKNPRGKGSLSSVVNRTVLGRDITVTRMQPQGDDLQVWIEEVSFNVLLAWLETLSKKEGLQVKGIDLNKSDRPGTVNVRRLQLGRI